MKRLQELDITKKKYIIFDMDGTIVDTIDLWNQIDYQLIKKFSNKQIELSIIQKDKDQYLKENNTGNIYLEYGGFLIKKYHLNTTKEELLNLRWQLSNELIKNKVQYMPGVVEAIKYLKELNYTLILATAGTRNHVDIYSKENINTSSKLNLYEYFDLILTKEDIEKKKPNPEIYFKILKIYNASPNECLVIEDSLHGIEAAKNANIETINFYESHSDNERDKINELTDFTIENYHEFLNYLIKNYKLPTTTIKKTLIKNK